MKINCVEICAGAGGQAIGLERAGFKTQALVEIDARCCETLLLNRPTWNVINQDVKDFSGSSYRGIGLLAGGVPCPPFSVAGKQLGSNDERDLFPEAIRLVDEMRPNAVMLENVRGFLDAVFEDYRLKLKRKLQKLGYVVDWRLLNASDYGVSQLRPRVVIVAIKKEFSENFNWCAPLKQNPLTVGELLLEQMQANGWKGAAKWSRAADDIAPTIVGGSKKHGGPDLGPTRSKQAWATLGVNGMTIADSAPEKDFVGMPRLTVEMVARIQGFPHDWKFSGKKTAAYRQVGNAFPPPVACAVAKQIEKCLTTRKLFAVSA